MESDAGGEVNLFAFANQERLSITGEYRHAVKRNLALYASATFDDALDYSILAGLRWRF